MPAQRCHVAVDLGAGSGRVMVGVLAGGRIALREVHRFDNAPVELPSGWHWDVVGLYGQVIEGLRRAAEWVSGRGVDWVSVGVDTWGVDYALVSPAGELVGLPHAYRDPRSEAAFVELTTRLGRQALYETTGIQPQVFNTLFQLAAHWQTDPQAVAAGGLLMMPDLFHHWLTGVRAVEATIASTTQLVYARTGRWARGLADAAEVPWAILGEIIPPGTRLGRLREAVREATGAPADVEVIVPASHDTASAVAAVPAAPGSSWCYLSSGTWSVLGSELTAPCLTLDALARGFSNERGVGGTIRFLKNIVGLWLVQQCRQQFRARGTDLSYADLTRAAERAAPFRTLVNTQHAAFLTPGDMPGRIGSYARATGQAVPTTPGEYVRCCLESLALSYREALDDLEAVLGRRFDVVHVVGGGGRNDLLNRMTADAVNRPVVVGPFEATAAGNILVQALGAGDVADPAQIRRIMAASFDLKTWTPDRPGDWEGAFERYRGLPVDP